MQMPGLKSKHPQLLPAAQGKGAAPNSKTPRTPWHGLFDTPVPFRQGLLCMIIICLGAG